MSFKTVSGILLPVIAGIFILFITGTDMESVSRTDSDETLDVLPLPSSAEPGPGRFVITRRFRIVHEGFLEGRLETADRRFLTALSRRTGRNFSEIPIGDDAESAAPSLRIECARMGTAVPGENETYRIVAEKDSILLSAETDIGIVRGLETLLQLVKKRDGIWFVEGIRIEDSPRFAWRGLLLDTARHFMPVGVIRRNLEAMAAAKLNVLHLHLSDDQAFRMESRAYPALHLNGSCGEYYTVGDMSDLVSFADSLGILVVPEFDVPAHTTSWFAGYPALASRPGSYFPARGFATFDNVMNPALESTYRFLGAFFRDMSEVFPGPYLHIGGDENTGRHWKENAGIRSFMAAEGLPDISSLQSYFGSNVAAAVVENGKIPVLWETPRPEAYAADGVFEIWWDERLLEKTVRSGKRVIRALGYYLDWCYPASHHYLVDPVPEGLPSDLSDNILGGEACMWSELVSPSTVDGRIWPRLASIAERFWSPAAVRDVPDMYRRLERFEDRLDELGLKYRELPQEAVRNLLGDAGTDSASLARAEDFIRLLEPVRRYRRQASGSYTVDSLLAEAADAARPDPPAAREFGALVNRYLSDRKNETEAGRRIRAYLINWKTMYDGMLEVPDPGPELVKLMPLVRTLSILSALGWEALEYLHDGTIPEPDWINLGETALGTAVSGRENVVLAVAPAIGDLLYAAAGLEVPEKLSSY